MSDEDVFDGIDDEEEGRKLSKKKLILFIGLPVLAIVIGLVAVVFLIGIGGEEEPTADVEQGESVEAKSGGPVVFFDLPELLVNLNTGPQKAAYLKIKVALELPGPASQARVEEMLPRVLDNMQVYLRELRLEDLSGSAGVQRLKEELLIRVNAAIEPQKVNDVLFKEMLVQ